MRNFKGLEVQRQSKSRSRDDIDSLEMSGYICSSCRMALRGRKTITVGVPRPMSARFSSSRAERPPPIDVNRLLEKPTWSVESLLPSEKNEGKTVHIGQKELHHLLRLSALPEPKNGEEEHQMKRTLESQLHFVREIQKVDTEEIEPLQAIRDETAEGIKERTIDASTLREALANEEFKGRNQRPRRRRDVPADTRGAEEWDIMGTAERKVGKYFVVDSSVSSDDTKQ